MTKTKIIITGVGGQGVVFLTEVLVEAAVRAGLPVATSEIHGLSQRGGSVTAGVTIGENTFGFVENGGADYLFGLEMIETQRCLYYLNKNSVVIVDNTKIPPHSVNTESVSYPDSDKLIDWLKQNVRKTVFIETDQRKINSVLRNLLVLGHATAQENFPIKPQYVEEAIRKFAKGDVEKSILAFRQGCA